jgi:hypothetical protein
MELGEQASRIKARDQRAFKEAVEALNAVISRVCKYEPSADLWVTDGEVFLMMGPPHSGGNLPYATPTEHRENIALEASIKASVGNW